MNLQKTKQNKNKLIINKILMINQILLIQNQELQRKYQDESPYILYGKYYVLNQYVKT